MQQLWYFVLWVRLGAVIVGACWLYLWAIDDVSELVVAMTGVSAETMSAMKGNHRGSPSNPSADSFSVGERSRFSRYSARPSR